MSNTELSCWTNFVDLIKRQDPNTPAMIYRGQADVKWEAISALDRLEQANPRDWKRRRNEWTGTTITPREVHLNTFKQLAAGRRGINPPDLSEDEWWILGQHHGLATPMLDWTLSPFVALYFAFEEEPSVSRGAMGNSPTNRAIYALSLNLLGSLPREDILAPFPIRPTKALSPRLTMQSGVLLKMPEGHSLEKYSAAPVKEHIREKYTQLDCPYTKYVINDEDRNGCLPFLDKMGISRSTLFPDLDGAAKYSNQLWVLGRESGLGYLPDGSRGVPIA